MKKKSIYEHSHDIDHEPVFENAVYVCVIQGPKDSPYFGRTYKLHVVISPEYPEVQPLVRFACVISHSQLNELNQPIPELYERHNMNWSSKSNLKSLLVAVYKMLEGPINQVLPPTLTDHDIFHNHLHEAYDLCLHSHPELGNKQEEKRVAAEYRRNWPSIVRKSWETTAAQMKTRIQTEKDYKPLHQILFPKFDGGKWKEEWFDARFYDAIKSSNSKELLSLMTEITPRVYSFPLFSTRFCDLLIEETKNYEKSGMPKSRPNSMNNYGLILNDMGLEGLLDNLMEGYLRPLAGLLYSDRGGGTIDHHHSFIVEYQLDHDLSLDMHTDDSDVTLNVCLTKGLPNIVVICLNIRINKVLVLFIWEFKGMAQTLFAMVTEQILLFGVEVVPFV